jgi:RNA polymerase sigma-70 factor (ECF subfamily)
LVAILRDALLDVPRLSAVDSRRAAGAEPRRARVSALYASHGARIFRFLRDLLGDGALAADATQETFVRAFRQLDAFDATRAAVPWLLGIARNVSLEVRRARMRRERVIVPGAADVDAEAGAGSPESELLGREAVRVVGAALSRLSEDRRAMLLLRLDHALSYEEIASLMGFSLAKVKVEIFRARAILRATLADYEGGAR